MIKPKITDENKFRVLEAVDNLVIYYEETELGKIVCTGTPYEDLVKEVEEGIYYCAEPQPVIEPEPIPEPEPMEYVDDSTALAELEEVIDND